MNHFLREIGLGDRRKFKELIIATRVAGAEQKGFTRYMNQMKSEERVVEQQRTGRRIMTYEEQLKLDSQRHVKFNQLSASEQAKLTAERDAMWGQIPEHLQAKARKLAGR